MADCSATIRTYRNLAVTLTAASLLCVVLLMSRYGIRLDTEGLVSNLLFISLLFGGGTMACLQNDQSRPGAAAAGIALVSLISLLGAATSMLVLRWGFPALDNQLLGLDRRLLGLDTIAIVSWTAEYPALAAALGVLYNTSIHLLGLSIIALGLLGQREHMWRTVFLYVGTLFTISLLSGIFPAKGIYVFVPPELREALPGGWGIYAFKTFDLWSGGQPNSLGLANLNGVATFPSFHTAAALLMVQAWWHKKRARSVLLAWCALVLLSTVPCGGHYAVDVIAGVIVVWLWVALSRRVHWPTFAKGRLLSQSLKPA